MTTRLRLTLGIDEAGRGPALGPMVMSAVVLNTHSAQTLTRLGLRDSKSYGAGPKAHARRGALAARIQELASSTLVEVIDVATIDARVLKRQLNHLERETAERMIDRSPRVDAIVADGRTLFAPLKTRFPHLLAMDRAESQHAAVAAASVLAKHRRDDEFLAICDRYRKTFGEIRGNGYANEGTRAFLSAYAERYHCLPPEARQSWPHDYLDHLLDPSANPERVDRQLDLF